MKVWINGRHLRKEEACVSVFDHGLLYGDGVFEGIRAYPRKTNRRQVFRLNDHLRRLWRSASGIGLQIPISIEELKEAVLDVFSQSEEVRYVRLLVTRGVGDLGLSPKSCKRPNIIIVPGSWETYYPQEKYRQGLRVIVAKTHNKPLNVLPPNIKSLNYLPNILAHMEAQKAGVDEALMLDEDNHISEACVDNLFFVKNEFTLITPPAKYVLEGITRAAVKRIAKSLGLYVSEGVFGVEDLYKAQELFLCGTAAEIIGIVEVNGRQIGDGRPGSVTKKIEEGFRQLAADPREGTSVPTIQMALI